MFNVEVAEVFLRIAIDENEFLQNEGRRAGLQILPKKKSSVMILPRFSTLKDHNEVPGQKFKKSEGCFWSLEHVEQVCQIS